MSISIINNYELNASIFLDSRRSIASLNDLKRISQAQDILYPHGFEVFCVQEGSYYVNVSPQGEVPEWKLRLINDEEPSFVSTYSSQKISELLQNAGGDDTNIGINDNEPSPVRVYSSQKVESVFAELRQEATRVDDDLLDIDTRVEYLEGEMWKLYEFDGSYDSLTNKPSLENYATKEYVDEAVANNGGGSVGSDIDTNNLVVTNSISMGRKEGTTIGEKSVALGYDVEASGLYSHAEGVGTTASGDVSHAEGDYTTASGNNSHAEGYTTTASGDVSHAEGIVTTASGNYSHAEGHHTEASGSYSHAEGNSTEAIGASSHAEGSNTTASGASSHSEGYYTKANGHYSHAEGYYTIASSKYQHVQGQYNIEDSANTYAHIVGNGDENNRSNAHTLDWEGNAWYAGNVTIGADNKELATKEYVDDMVANVGSEEDEGNSLPLLSSICMKNEDGSLVVTSGVRPMDFELIPKDETVAYLDDITNTSVLNNAYLGLYKDGELTNVTLRLSSVFPIVNIGYRTNTQQLVFGNTFNTILCDLTNGTRTTQNSYSLSAKANSSDILTKTNTTEYTPTENYHPATKKYVDDAIIQSAVGGNVDLSGYATKEYVDEINFDSKLTHYNYYKSSIFNTSKTIHLLDTQNVESGATYFTNVDGIISLYYNFEVDVSSVIGTYGYKLEMEMRNGNENILERKLCNIANTSGANQLVSYMTTNLFPDTTGSFIVRLTANSIYDESGNIIDSPGKSCIMLVVGKNVTAEDYEKIKQFKISFAILKQNFLQLDNINEYTPTKDYHPVTKKYVDDTIVELMDSNSVNDYEIAKVNAKVSSIYNTKIQVLDGKFADNVTYYTNADYSVTPQIGAKYAINIQKILDSIGVNDVFTTVFKYKANGEDYIDSYTFETGVSTGTIVSVELTMAGGTVDALFRINVYKEYDSNISLVDSEHCSVYMTFSKDVSVELIDEIVNSMDLSVFLGSLNVLTLSNKEEYTPTKDYHPATKKYVDKADDYIFSELIESQNHLKANNSQIMTDFLDLSNPQHQRKLAEAESAGYFYFNLETDISNYYTGTNMHVLFLDSEDKAVLHRTGRTTSDSIMQISISNGVLPSGTIFNGTCRITKNKIYEYGESITTVESVGKSCVMISIPKASNTEAIINELRTLKVKVLLTKPNFLTFDNNNEFVPTKDYHPTTKKYVDNYFISDIYEDFITITAEEMNSSNNGGRGIYIDKIKTLDPDGFDVDFIYYGYYKDKIGTFTYSSQFNMFYSDILDKSGSQSIALCMGVSDGNLVPMNSGTQDVKNYQFTEDFIIKRRLKVNANNIATKKYVDDSLPSIEKFKLVSSTTHNLDFDNLTYSNGNTKVFCYPTNMPTSGNHYVKYTLTSSDGVYTGTKQEANGDPVMLELTEGKAYAQGTLTIGSIPKFSISFNRTITFNDDGTFKQYSFDPNTSMVFCRFVDGDGYPRQWTITIEFYEIDNNCVAIKYNIPDNLENGTGSYSLQQVGNSATGSNSVALGNLNEGSGYLLGYNNKSTGTAISIGKGNNSTGPSYVLGEGNTVASGFAIGTNNKAEGVTTVVGNGLTSTTPKSQNKGSMIIGAGGTLAQDTLFAISTGLRTANASTYHTVRYPFEAKEDGTTYLRGANVVLESENAPSADNHLVTKKYVDEAVANNGGGSGGDVDLSSYATKEYVDEKVAQSDWNEIDTNNPAYIKNKPFYLGTERKTLVKNTFELNGSTAIDSFDIIEDTTYTIIYNGITYECTPIIQDIDGGRQYILGNYKFYDNVTDTGEPFAIEVFVGDGTGWEDYTCIIARDKPPGTMIDLEIIGNCETVVKLDEIFLPDNIATKEYVDEAISSIDTGSDIDTNDLVITNSISMGRKADTEIGIKSLAVGINTEASGNFSHAEGNSTTASGIGSHAEGSTTTASGNNSHAEGYYTIASSRYQHVQGQYNIEDSANTYAHIVGNGTSSARSNAHTLDWDGNAWFAGNVTIGADNKELATKEYVDGAIDTDNLVVTNSISMGRKEGTTIGTKSMAVGSNTTASGYASHAEGDITTASGDYSHAEGANTTASGSYSHAEGANATASGSFSHAEGFGIIASGDYSHAEGYRTIASSENQHVQGKFNIEDTANTYAHIVGNGTSSTARSNAHTVDWDGNAWYKGNVTVDGTPTADNDLVTKKYVDDAVANLSELKMNIVNGLTFTNAYINYNNGDYVSGGSAYACQEYIPVISGATYEVSGVSNIVRIAYYDSSKAYINQYIDNTPTFNFTPPSNASYIRVHVDSTSNTWQNLSIESEIEDYIRAYINNATSGGSGNVDLSLYALKTDLHSHSNKTVIDTITSDMITKWNQSIPFNDTYVSDCNAWLTNGYVKTGAGQTSNLPSACTGSDRWGILFFIAENVAQGTGTQMYFPIDGTYKGRIFTRSLTNMNQSPNVGQWSLVSISNVGASSLTNESTTPTVSDVSASSLANESTTPTISNINASTNEGYLNGLLSKMEALEEKIKALEEKIKTLEEKE